MDDAARLCARLLVRGTLPRAEATELDHPTVRSEVEARLGACGLMLATSAYSEHVGLRLSREGSDPTVLDAPTNLGLGADGCALLTVLWARLALQQRTAGDATALPGQQALLASDRRAAARNYAPTVRFETLVREFGRQLGGKVRLNGLLAHLKRLGFVEYRRLDAISAGPLLELAIDGERMVAFIRSRVLERLLEPPPQLAAEPAAPTLEDRIGAALSEGQELTIGDLERATSLPRRTLHSALHHLKAEGRVETLGTRNHTRYRIVRRGTDVPVS